MAIIVSPGRLGGIGLACGIDVVNCDIKLGVDAESGFFMLFSQKEFFLELVWNMIDSATQNGAVGFAFCQILI